MRLRISDFKLPDSAGLNNIEDYDRLAKKVAAIGESTGKSSRWFESRCMEYRSLINSRAVVREFVQAPKDVRVVLHLWKSDPEWLSWRPPNLESLKHLFAKVRGFRPSHLIDLQDIYFRYFDALPDYFKLGLIISNSLKKTAAPRLLPQQRKMSDFLDLIFGKQGPEKIAQRAIKNNQSYVQCMQDIGLAQYSVGRYAHACKNAYFIKTAESIEIGSASPMFAELHNDAVADTAYDKRLNLGQKVCQVLIQRCARRSEGMPENWVNTVVDIIGDPRRPKTSASYQKWWASMAREDEANMRRWLAGADLRLFLKILKDSSSDEALQRMYPARRKFLEGLLENHDIVDARLFLSRSARELIKREFGAEYLAAHGELADANKTVIYVNIENKLHFFEGTHNFKARGGGVLPENHRVLSRTAKRFDYDEFTFVLEADLRKAGRAQNPPLEMFARVHHPPLKWQSELIWEFEYYGVNVDPETVLTKQDYLKYRRTFGV